MSIRQRLGDAQLYGPTSQATASYPAGVMLNAADWANWQAQASAINAATYAANLATFQQMAAAPQTPPAPPVVGLPPAAIASPASAAAAIPAWVYFVAAGAAALLIFRN